MTVYHPIEMDYEEAGTGVPLVLLHGFPFNRSIWHPILPYLTEHARIIIPDLRGFGKTPDGNEPSTMRLMAEDLFLLTQKLKIKKFFLAGHSMGGYISLAFAAAYPQLLSGLGLVTTQAASDSQEKRQARFKTIESVKKHGAAVLAKEMPAVLTQHKDLFPAITTMILYTQPNGIINALKGMADRPDFTEILTAIHVPTLIITGQNDKIVPEDRIKTMQKLIPNNWVVKIPGGGHMPMMEAPELVAKSLLDLIKSKK